MQIKRTVNADRSEILSKSLDSNNLSFWVLVVDDRIDETQPSGLTLQMELEKAFEHTCVRFDFARSKKAAMAYVRSTFYHAALVDHNLAGAFGREVLDDIRLERPTCYRILVTKDPEIEKGGAPLLFNALFPNDQAAMSLAIRQLAEYDETINELLVGRDSRQVLLVDGRDNSVIRDNDHVLLKVMRKRIGALSPLLTYNEIQHVFNALFLSPRPLGYTEPRAEPSGDDIHSITCFPMERGRSKSVVLDCIPKTRSGHNGTRCIVKIGRRHEGDEEVRRFNRYVRYYRSASRRVELLGSVSADSITAICYSFAGGGVGAVVSLNTLMKKRDQYALRVLADEYDVEKREWYKQVEKLKNVTGLTEFSRVTHFRNMTGVVPTWQDTLASVNELIVAQKIADVPSQWLGTVQLGLRQTPSHTCVVHGDLNAENLLVALDERIGVGDVKSFLKDWTSNALWVDTSIKDPKTIMIDYRHTERGPVFLDFAHLELSCRMLPEVIDLAPRPASEYVAQDCNVEALVWQGEPGDDASERSLDELSYELLVSYVLGRSARRNFEGRELEWSQQRSPPFTWRRQYAATCILLGLHLWKFPGLGNDIVLIDAKQPDIGFKELGPIVRLRIASWIYAQSKVFFS